MPLGAVKTHLALMNAMKYHYTDSENEKKVYEFIESESDGVEEGWKGTEQNVNMSCCC